MAIACPTASMAQTTEVPSWLFPLPARSEVADSVTLRRVPGSQATFTEARAHNPFAVADWHPGTHPAMPDIVAHGRKPAVAACAYCHLPDGSGRPGNAMLAGLPAAYIIQQVADMKSHARRSAWPAPYMPSDDMQRIADSATDEEVAVAARYFSGLVPRQRSQVVEATEIPQSLPSLGLYVQVPNGGHEPLGRRLVEMPADVSRHELRDPWVGYVAYVPPGSIERGRGLATACESCHGPGLRGVGPVPPLAGRPPSYLLRQLFAFRAGTRSTPAGTSMRAVAAKLEFDDMIAAAAYAGSRTP